MNQVAAGELKGWLEELQLRGDRGNARKDLSSLFDHIGLIRGPFEVDISDLYFMYEIDGMVGRWPLNSMRTSVDRRRFLEQAGLAQLRWVIARLHIEYGPILRHADIQATDVAAVDESPDEVTLVALLPSTAPRVPSQQVAVLREGIGKTLEKLRKDNGADPSLPEVAEALGMTRQVLRYRLEHWPGAIDPDWHWAPADEILAKIRAGLVRARRRRSTERARSTVRGKSR
jgi:hypothetical protein